MPVFKKPAAKRPAACTDLVPYKKPRSDKDEQEDHEEEEQEEEQEDEEEQDEKEPEENEEDSKETAKDAPAKQVRLSKAALENHQKFVKEAAEKNLTLDQIDTEMKRANNKTQMSLWKAFENDRISTGEQESFRKAAGGGTGTQKKKRRLLGSWIMDGGKCTRHYKQAIQSFTVGAT